ncbi:MAG TPA: hypothetical protein DDZ81_15225 [Acetobacteraceae bacterium]|jgi:uncharacterized protein YjiS (DUF1127 family)|nr:hypothetical protein [Acetobacteraceae bacterium]
MNASTTTYGHAGTTGHTGGLLPLISAKLQNVRARWAEKRARARDMQDLYRFSDRELWDIGMSRSDFMAVENGTFRRD